MLKVVEKLKDHLLCKVIFLNKMRAWLEQPHLIENLEKNFCEQVERVRKHAMPGMPKFSIIRPVDDSGRNSVEEKKVFWF